MKRVLVMAMVVGAVCAVRAENFVTYEAFGAVGDGVTDDQKAIVAAHAAANERGLPVRAGDGKTYYIGPGADPAQIETDVDFGTARFVIDDTAVPLKTKNVPIFRVAASRPPFAVKGVTTLARGQAKLEIALPGPCLLQAVNDKVKQYIRYGHNQNKGSGQREVFLVAADGMVDPCTPIVWDFPDVTSLTAYPLEEKTLTLRGGVFVTKANRAESRYDYHSRNILINRSNVRVEGLRHEVTDELDHGAPYGGFVAVVESANVTVTGCTFTAHRAYRTVGSAGLPVTMGSYDITANRSVNVSYVNCTQTTDILDKRYWGLFGSNYCKNLLYDGCTFSRFDAHMGVANATVRNCVLGHMGINAIGFGTFLVENTTVNARNFVNLRSDYGSTWNGDLVIRNCRFVPAGGRSPAVGTLVNASYSGQHDFGYPCHMPRCVVVDGLVIDDARTPKNYQGPFAFADYNKKNVTPDFEEKFPYHPTEELVLRNVTTTSGKPLQICPNANLFRALKVVHGHD